MGAHVAQGCMSSRARTYGLRKVCDCGRRQWPKCPHTWHFSFKPRGGRRWRFSLDIELGHHIASKTEADTEADRIRTELRNGTFQPAAGVPHQAQAPKASHWIHSRPYTSSGRPRRAGRGHGRTINHGSRRSVSIGRLTAGASATVPSPQSRKTRSKCFTPRSPPLPRQPETSTCNSSRRRFGGPRKWVSPALARF